MKKKHPRKARQNPVLKMGGIIQNPLYYERARSMLRRAAMSERNAWSLLSEELKRVDAIRASEQKLKAELAAMTELHNLARREVRQGQFQLDMLPRAGVHAPGVMKLAQKIVEELTLQYEYNDNGPDSFHCPGCSASKHINHPTEWKDSDHAEDCIVMSARHLLGDV